MKRMIGKSVLLGGIGVALVCATGTTNAQQKVFTLSSTTFKDGSMLPVKAANSKANAPNNANCVGDNVSPQLSWANPPDGTKSYVLLMEDPEGRGGAGVHHMVTYGIAPTITGFAEGELSKPSDKYVGGISTPKLAHYFGPCTPPGDWHHYTWTLIATDLDPKALQPGMTREELLKALDGHAKGAAGLVMRFTHP